MPRSKSTIERADPDEIQRLLLLPTISLLEYRRIEPQGANQAYERVANGEIAVVRLGTAKRARIRVLTAPLRKRWQLDGAA